MYGRGGGPVPAYDRHSNTVVQIDNVCEDVTPDHLFTLCGVYGDVLRVKTFFGKPKAIVQFKDPQAAQAVVHYLEGCPFLGQTLHLYVTHMPEVRLQQKPSEDGKERTKDYTNSPHHRYAKGMPYKHMSHLSPPSVSLYISNVHPVMDEQQLADLFAEHASINRVMLFPPIDRAPDDRQRRMGIVETTEVEGAVTCLIALHNYQIQGQWMKINFSDKRIDDQVRAKGYSFYVVGKGMEHPHQQHNQAPQGPHNPPPEGEQEIKQERQ
eukprot:TRINITY_DN69538_c0_g1_i1.p1 TRINITY_DN69538_c0_g1~~TRINITY_DN69538_c0_g1_i1.p1  ORF type:complete len:267 (+),score=23.36 TRINITY_DN69538_c0_g1_i1:2-802(+)